MSIGVQGMWCMHTCAMSSLMMETDLRSVLRANCPPCYESSLTRWFISWWPFALCLQNPPPEEISSHARPRLVNSGFLRWWDWSSMSSLLIWSVVCVYLLLFHCRRLSVAWLSCAALCAQGVVYRLFLGRLGVEICWIDCLCLRVGLLGFRGGVCFSILVVD